MATKSYDDYEVEQLAKAKQKTAEYEQARRQQAAAAASKVADSYNSAIKQAEGQYKQSAADTEESYRSAYDANVINELVARRNATEAIANAGAVNSGLNTTQQTAISLMRGNADHNTTQQKQAAVDAIMRELDNVRADYVRQSAAEQNAIYNEADADIRNKGAAYDQSAQNVAASLYTQDQQNAQAAADRAWEEYLLNLKYQNEAAAAEAQRQWETDEAAANRQWETDEAAANRQWETDEAAAQRRYDAEQALLGREHDVELADLQYYYDKHLAEAAHQADINMADLNNTTILNQMRYQNGMENDDGWAYSLVDTKLTDNVVNPYGSIPSSGLLSTVESDRLVDMIIQDVIDTKNGKSIEDKTTDVINALYEAGMIKPNSRKAIYERALAKLEK